MKQADRAMILYLITLIIGDANMVLNKDIDRFLKTTSGLTD